MAIQWNLHDYSKPLRDRVMIRLDLGYGRYQEHKGAEATQKEIQRFQFYPEVVTDTVKVCELKDLEIIGLPYSDKRIKTETFPICDDFYSILARFAHLHLGYAEARTLLNRASFPERVFCTQSFYELLNKEDVAIPKSKEYDILRHLKKYIPCRLYSLYVADKDDTDVEQVNQE